MKKLILTAAVVAALASPALAQSYDPDIGTGNILPPQVWQQQQVDTEATGSLAYAPRGSVRAQHDAQPAQAVDTDPNIALRERIDAPNTH